MKVAFDLFRSPTVKGYENLKVDLSVRVSRHDPIMTALDEAEGVNSTFIIGDRSYHFSVDKGGTFTWDEVKASILRTLRQFDDNVEVISSTEDEII